jgi:hypothetical protein
MSAELEYKTLTSFLGPEQQAQLDALAKDGWQVMQGTQPVAIFSLVRVKPQKRSADELASIGGFGDLKIDETKIHHIRGGRVVNPDGTIKDEEESKRILSGEAKLG